MKRAPDYGLFAFDTVWNLLELLIYAVSVMGPFYLLWGAQDLALPWLVLLGLALWPVTGVIFGALLVVLARLSVRQWPSGRMLLGSRGAIPWFILDRLMKIMFRSPFRSLLEANCLLRMLFYRGMGAKLDWSLMIGQGVKITEPWLVKLGHHVLLGDESHLAAHKVEGSVVTLEAIEIGDETVVGAGAIVFPGCRIGNRVTIGAKSTVSRRTVIPDGETWVGVPARKYDYFSRMEAGERD